MAGEINFGALQPLNYAQVLQSFGAGTEQTAQRQQLAVQTRQLARQDIADKRSDTERAALAASVGPDGQIDYSKVKAAKIASGDINGAMAVDTNIQAAHKAKIDAALAENGAIAQLIGSVTSQGTYDAARQKAESMGLNVGSLPPVYDPTAVDQLRQSNLTTAEQLKAKQAEAEFDLKKQDTFADNKRADAQFGETVRSNRVGEGQRGQGLALQREGMLRTDARAREATAAKTQGGVGPDGEKLKMIPPAAVGGIQNNITTLRKVDQAIRALKARPQSVGPGTGMLGDTFTQYNDTAGTDARSKLGEVAGAKIHDLSGAAVNASEAPRFTPFIPSATDRPDVALRKLQNFRDQLQSQVGEQQAYYAPQNGYREYKGAGTPARAAPAATPAGKAGWSIQRVK